MEHTAQTYSQHIRAIFKLGIPLIAINLAQFAIHITDTIMLGWYDVQALAAATVATSLFFVIFILGAGFAIAVTPLVAAAIEEDDTTQVRRVTRMGLWLSILYGVAFIIPFFWAEEILLAMGQTSDVAALGRDYLRIAIFGMVPALVVMTFKSFLAALEHTGVILWATVVTAILNGFLNYVLIFGNFGAPELGIQGAAIASVIMQITTVLLFLAYSSKKLPQFELTKNIWRPDWEVLRRVFGLGWPIGLTGLAESGLFSASAIMMGWIGEIELAAHGIALQLAATTFMVHIGFSQVATVRAGRALGRHDEENLRKGGISVITMSLIFALFTVLLFLVFPRPLISFFIDPFEPARDQLITIGISLLALAAVFQVVDALQAMALGLLRGVQDTTVPMVMAAISYWVIGLPAGYLLAFTFGFGAEGLWWGLVVGLSAASVLLMWRFWRRSVYI
jgi:MATE family multidrug resistance protein